MLIEYLLWLQNLREVLPGWVTSFFMLVSDLVVGPVIALVPCLVFWCFDRRRGLKVVFSLALGSFAVNLTKVVLCVPRPFMVDARVQPYPKALKTATGYSFPSGHTQTATSVFGSMGWSYRKDFSWALPLAVVMTCLVALSRNVLGVHTIVDVLGGLTMGVLSIVATEWLLGWLDGGDRRRLMVAIIACIVSLAACLFADYKPYPALETVTGTSIDPAEMALDCYEAAGLLSGAFVCAYLGERYAAFEETSGWKNIVLRGVIGAVVMLLFRYVLIRPIALLGWEHVTLYCKSFLTVLGALVVGPWLFCRAEERFMPQKG